MIISENTDLTAGNVQDWIATFKNAPEQQPRLRKLGQYYDNKNPIVKKGAAKNRPNYSIHIGVASYITDVQTGYFLGRGVAYDWKEKVNADGNITEPNEFKDTLTEIFANNFEPEENYAIANDMSCYGIAFEVVMIDDAISSSDIKKKLRFTKLDPEETFLVTDNSVLHRPVCVINMYPSAEIRGVIRWKGYVYSKDQIIPFDLNGAAVELKEPIDHQFKDIPVVIFKNNYDEIGDYEPVQDQLDALALTFSNETDDLQSIANAILAIYGAMATDEKEIDAINKNKVAKLPSDAKMEFVVKNVNIDAVKHHIDQNLDLIYQISKTPDLTDDKFSGQQSGVAMQYKLWGIEQCRVTKARYFRRALYQRIKLLLQIISLAENRTIYDISQKIDFIFYKNLPQNEMDIIDAAYKLQGLVSTRTLLEQIPFVNDVDLEIEELAKEKEAEAAAFAAYNETPENSDEAE